MAKDTTKTGGAKRSAKVKTTRAKLPAFIDIYQIKLLPYVQKSITFAPQSLLDWLIGII